jgi:hypothetical protein
MTDDKYELIDFGDNCMPNFLIRNVLKIKHKTLFMLGGFYFNDIIKYLKDGQFEKIYQKEYLFVKNTKNNNLIKINNFDNKIEKYCESDVCIINTKYNFISIHDYDYDKIENKINNYEFIVNEFNVKINNLINSFNNDKILIFIHFHNNKYVLSSLQLDNMINILNNYIKKQYYLFIFSNKNTGYVERKNKYTNVFYSHIKKDYSKFYELQETPKNELVDELNSSFNNLINKLPKDE